MPSQDPSSQIERVPLHEEVTNRLRDMIVSLRLPPGERIQELEVAQLLGVSRTPVREAIKVLTAEGLVELLPLRGAIVKAFSAKDARDMLEVIALVETYAGERACQADPARIDAILEMHQEMKRLFEARQRLAYFALNQRIHEALIALADNDTLSMTHATLSKRMRSLRYSGNSTPENWTAAMSEHEQMMVALAARDGQALSRIMGEHIRNTWPRIQDVVS
jgi:DNA-binding GntR family transcriptional regulator